MCFLVFQVTRYIYGAEDGRREPHEAILKAVHQTLSGIALSQFAPIISNNSTNNVHKIVVELYPWKNYRDWRNISEKFL